jgi:hypothetical protein
MVRRLLLLCLAFSGGCVGVSDEIVYEVEADPGRADGIGSRQIRLAITGELPVHGNTYAGTISVTEPDPNAIRVTGVRHVLAPGMTTLRLAVGQTNWGTSNLGFVLEKRAPGGDWDLVKTVGPVTTIVGVYDTIRDNYFEDVRVRPNGEMTYWKYQLVDWFQFQLPGVEDATEYGVNVFPIKTRFGALAGDYQYTLTFNCSVEEFLPGGC